jgi:malate dehydrogenase
LDRITVVGAGHVGATTAQRIAERELAREVLLIDVVPGLPEGKALDQWESAPVEGFDTRLRGLSSYEETAGSGVYVVTAGLARKPGMSRSDLVMKNAAIIRSIAKEIAAHSPQAIILMVTNPLDVMAYVAKETTGFDRRRVIGMAGILDTARFRSFIALELDVSVQDVQALVLGGHGDSMVPLVSSVSVGGIPLTQMLDEERIEALVERTRKGGGEIVALLKSGSAYYAPSAAVTQMCESIVRDKKRVLPCSVWLEGEYGLEGLFLGVPCKLGRVGLEEILEAELTDGERAALERSAAEVKETMDALPAGEAG